MYALMLLVMRTIKIQRASMDVYMGREIVPKF
jgi:hypothetical protein